MAPFFASGRVASGIEATVELLVARAQTVAEHHSRRNQIELSHGSGGGGAEQQMPIGAEAALAPKKAAKPTAFSPGATPLETLAAYRRLLRMRIKDPNLPLYTPETREFLSEWTVTDAQQRNELQEMERSMGRAREIIAKDKAVVRFPTELRSQSPYFFKKSSLGWQLDLAAMSRLIRFNHLNQWHFTSADHAFAFAFVEERIDQNGFVHPRWERRE